MAEVETYRQILESVLLEYTLIPYAYVDFQTEAIFDRDRDRYILVNAGWDKGRRAHWTLIHIDIINSKLWIQCDNTEGVALELVRSGIPRDRIVLGFHAPNLRQYTDYAVA